MFLASLQKYAPWARVIVMVDKQERQYAERLAKRYPLHVVRVQPVTAADVESLLLAWGLARQGSHSALWYVPAPKDTEVRGSRGSQADPEPPVTKPERKSPSCRLADARCAWSSGPNSSCPESPAVF